MEHKTHKIKLLNVFVEDVLSGEKSFEIRINDRNYQKGDLIKFIPVSDIESDLPIGVGPSRILRRKTYVITHVLIGVPIERCYILIQNRIMFYLDRFSLLRLWRNINVVGMCCQIIRGWVDNNA